MTENNPSQNRTSSVPITSKAVQHVTRVATAESKCSAGDLFRMNKLLAEGDHAEGNPILVFSDHKRVFDELQDCLAENGYVVRSVREDGEGCYAFRVWRASAR